MASILVERLASEGERVQEDSALKKGIGGRSLGRDEDEVTAWAPSRRCCARCDRLVDGG
jgi:hypothetical protein